jgi:TctA family transporter
MGGGDLGIFLNRPIALVLFVLALAVLFGSTLLKAARRLMGRPRTPEPAAEPSDTVPAHKAE